MATRILWMAVLLAISTAASAEVYRWVDAQGRVYYSDRPVENAQLVSVASRPTDREAVAARTQAESTQRAEAANNSQQSDQAVAKAVQQDVEKARAEQCKEAQAAYKTATEKQRLYRVGKDGERQYLTDAELTEARINAKKAVDELCKPAA